MSQAITAKKKEPEWKVINASLNMLFPRDPNAAAGQRSVPTAAAAAAATTTGKKGTVASKGQQVVKENTTATNNSNTTAGGDGRNKMRKSDALDEAGV